MKESRRVCSFGKPRVRHTKTLKIHEGQKASTQILFLNFLKKRYKKSIQHVNLRIAVKSDNKGLSDSSVTYNMNKS